MFTFSRHCLLRKPRNALLLLTDVQFACFTSPGWARLSTRMSSHFRVIEHTINCSHSREYPAGSANGIVGGNELKLAVKQYIPLDNPEPKSGDVTIVATHANGVPKELYEPLWDDMHHLSKQAGLRIRGIWMADVATQGQSGIMNEDHLGNDPSWFDHSRDLLHLINLKQDDMPHPIVGIGHSFGATQLAQLSLYHPRLLRSLVLIEPVITYDLVGKGSAIMSTFRRDVWDSRRAAEEKFRSNKFYQAWDPRALEKWIEYGLRDATKSLDPSLTVSGSTSADEKPVTLATTKHQEVFMYMRPSWRGADSDNSHKDKKTYPDYDPIIFGEAPEYPFYRYEPAHVHDRLPELRPNVLYVFGEKSDYTPPETRRDLLSRTGTGVGGSGGEAAGKVRGVEVPGGHFVVMEKISECAEGIVRFLGEEMEAWKREVAEFNREWRQKSRREKVTIDEEWVKRVRGENGNRRSKQDSKI